MKKAYVEERTRSLGRLGTLGMYSSMHCDVQLVHSIQWLGMYSWYIVFPRLCSLTKELGCERDCSLGRNMYRVFQIVQSTSVNICEWLRSGCVLRSITTMSEFTNGGFGMEAVRNSKFLKLLQRVSRSRTIMTFGF